MYLLDTNVLSEMRKLCTEKVDPNVDTWSSGVRSADLFFSVITLQEIEQGVIRMERRDRVQGAMLRTWFDRSVLALYRDRILPVTIAIARAAAILNVPDKRGFGDGVIAATARVHGLKMVTRNVSHFAGAGLEIINPWLPPGGA